MPGTGEPRVRPSIAQLQARYEAGDREPLENLVRAWRGIQELPVDDPWSFFMLGGYHGEPFEYRAAVDRLPQGDIYTYWGGWCNHGNVLFPTWHRIYVYQLEQALQRIVPGVMLPYWDETSDASLTGGIPSILTQETFVLDGQEIKNPLRSFVLPKTLSDDLPGDDQIYVKPAGYETVRYPLSGLVGTEEARKTTEAHNARFPDPGENTALLNENVITWLRGGNPTPGDPTPSTHGVLASFKRCLDAPNYTVFSNTSSAAEWNRDHPGTVVALESPHNDIHLAVGGFDAPGQPFESGQIAGANGDMGENNTAGLDPIFFFHHCNVDRMFWLWQKRHGSATALEIIEGYAGTNSNELQGPTPGVAPGTQLTLESPLRPFAKPDGSAYTSLDCVDIENQLGYTYAPGSFDNAAESGAVGTITSVATGRKLTVRGIDRALFQGSFVLEADAAVTDESGTSTRHYVGHHSVLSRRNVVRCVNCLAHLEVVAHFPLDHLPAEVVDSATFKVRIQHRGSGMPAAAGDAIPVVAALPDELNMTIEITD